MSLSISVSNMVRIEKLRPPRKRDDLGKYALARRAYSFLLSQKWCERIKEGFVGMVHEGILGVFYFRLDPAPGSGADEEVWVIVGDLPPAYIACELCPNPAAALDGYYGEMQTWVKAVCDGSSTDKLIPVNAPATKEYADMLNGRLDFIDKEILSLYEDDLAK
jgi:hypothetical protein